MELSYSPLSTKVVLIGVSKYASPADFIPIEPVLNNLETLGKIFSDPHIFGIPGDNILVLHNKTNTEIIREIKRGIQSTEIETLIIYYAGHGHRTDKNRLFLTATNSERDFDLIETSGIEFRKFKEIIENSPARQSIFIIDACYSGIATQSSETLTQEEQVIKGTFILTSSSQSEQSLFNAQGKFTFFTRELINLLEQGNETFDACISVADLYNHLRKNLRDKNLPEPQRKDNLNIGSFYLAKNRHSTLENLLLKAKVYEDNLNYPGALAYYEKIQKQFKSHDIQSEITRCKAEVEFIGIVQQGDKFFYTNFYEKALEQYFQAEKIRKESSLTTKIQKCIEYIDVIKTQKLNVENVREETRSSENKPGSKVREREEPSKVSNTESKPTPPLPPPPKSDGSTRYVMIGGLVIGVLLVWNIYFNARDTSQSSTRSSMDSIAALLQSIRSNDSIQALKSDSIEATNKPAENKALTIESKAPIVLTENFSGTMERLTSNGWYIQALDESGATAELVGGSLVINAKGSSAYAVTFRSPWDYTGYTEMKLSFEMTILQSSSSDNSAGVVIDDDKSAQFSPMLLLFEDGSYHLKERNGAVSDFGNDNAIKKGIGVTNIIEVVITTDAMSYSVNSHLLKKINRKTGVNRISLDVLNREPMKVAFDNLTLTIKK